MTKQNCVTLWEKDADGNQVWAGREGCEPVTWQECQLVDKEVKFLVPDITCSPKEEVWYHEPELVNKTETTQTFRCSVRLVADINLFLRFSPRSGTRPTV